MLLSQADSGFDYWKQLCIVSHFGYLPSFSSPFADVLDNAEPVLISCACLFEIPLTVKNDQ